MSIPFLDLNAMHAEIMDDALAAFERLARTSSFVLGDDVRAFEEEFAAYCGTQYAVGVDSGLSALKLALLAHDLKPGDEVLIPANTFVATAAAAAFIGLQPVFVDVVPDTYNIDPVALEAEISSRTRAIMPVHLYGTPADMDPILAVAKRHKLLVIEDAAQAHGAVYKGRKAGSMGHSAGFSFYPGKNLGAFGEAGIVTTNDKEVADKIKAMRNCGQIEKYHHVYPPYNHRLDTIQAAMLRLKLRKLDQWNEQRRQVARWYDELLSGTQIVRPVVPADTTPVWHLYVVRCDQRDALRAYLAEQGIGTGIHYPIPVHLSPVYADLGYRAGDFPVTETAAQQIISLPMFPHMTLEQVATVAAAIKEFELMAMPVV